ncbi:CHAD domain-containing protein [Methyloligella sp. 2.7D]|uniref:CHAD domain-containing protein n=1 Tax=unclassified Methyloligella TaxID=2625955 RepID=UPI00157D0FCE|nr:CHAD domain-containing protein [Methyloligella sp. GL2]QKP76736.1 CHAD domain-containing protein [Methyloligella sp. GL2]
MGYSLDPAQPVTQSVRQVALKEIDNAKRWLCDPDFHAGVHNARKCLKRLRSLLELIRPGISEPLFDYLTDNLKDTAHQLAPARDVQALIDTVEKMGKNSAALSKGSALPEIRGWLDQRRSVVESRSQADPVAKALADLDALRPQFAKLTVYPDNFEPIGEGLEQTYRATRKAADRAFKKKTDEALHDWRKHVQQHWRQLQLLTPCWPETLGPRAEHVHSLAQLLGDDHDLSNLRRLLAAPAMSFGKSGDTKKLTKHCLKEQKGLRTEAKHLAARLFAEKPKTFLDRIEAHWQAIADRQKPDPQSGQQDAAPSEDDSEESNVLRFGKSDEWRVG